MSIQNALSIELKREKDNTLRMLNALPNEQFGWKPHEKSMSIGEISNHIQEGSENTKLVKIETVSGDVEID